MKKLRLDLLGCVVSYIELPEINFIICKIIDSKTVHISAYNTVYEVKIKDLRQVEYETKRKLKKIKIVKK